MLSALCVNGVLPKMHKRGACPSRILQQLACITSISISQSNRVKMKYTFKSFMSFAIFMQLTSTALSHPTGPIHDGNKLSAEQVTATKALLATIRVLDVGYKSKQLVSLILILYVSWCA
jgi:hypothetical protein